MKVKEAMSKNVLSVDSNDMLTKALSKMGSNKVHQLVIFDRKNFHGVLELKSIITKKDINPSATKVSGFVRNAPSLGPEEDLLEAAQMIVNSGLRALPVAEKGSVIGVLSETDVIRSTASELAKKDVKLRDLMTPCVYLDKDAKASKIQNLMFETNVSRIPILDGNNVVGVVGTLDLIKVLEAKASPSDRSSKSTEKDAHEKIRVTDAAAETIMSKPIVLDDNRTLAESIQLLQSNEEIIVNGENIGIITPKDILALVLKKEPKGIRIQFVGIEDEGIEFKAKMDALVQKFTKKHGSMIEYLLIHLEKMQKQGPKQKYSIRIRLKTPFGFFVAHSWGWKPVDVLQDAFSTIEKEATKKQERDTDLKKSQKQKSKRR